MSRLDDEALDDMLAAWKVARVPEGLASRLALNALSFPQRRPAGERLRAMLAAIVSDVFGNAADTPLLNRRWRMAMSALALIVGIYSGMEATAQAGPGYFTFEEMGVDTL